MKYIQAQSLARLFKALGHPVRIQMIDALCRGDHCVGDLHRLTPVCQANVSRHLAWLKRVGLVSERRVGPRVIHHLACPGIQEIMEGIASLHQAHAKRTAEGNRPAKA